MSILFAKIIYIFLGLVILKMIYNVYYFILAKHYFSSYEKFFKERKGWYIQENRQNIIKLFKKANLRDVNIPYAENIGYNLISNGSYSLYDNLSLLEINTIQHVYKYLMETQAVFKNRIFESLNPIYWLETFLFIPKIALDYLGFSANDFLIKFLQLFWWGLNIIGIIIGVLFNKEFVEWFKKLIN